MTQQNPANPFYIEWNIASKRQWDAMLKACKNANIMQTWQNSMALAKTTGSYADTGIIHFEGKPVGMVIVHIRKTFKFMKFCKIYRGPIWIYDEVPPKMQELVYLLLRQRYHLLKGKPLMLHPELANNDNNHQILRNAKFKRVQEGYVTSWVDLTQSEEQLQQNMNRRWRRSLKQSHKNALTLQTDTQTKYLDWMLKVYSEDKQKRGYKGPSPEYIRALQELYKDNNGVIVMRAVHKNQPVAGLILVIHGNTATYIVGWNGEQGRKLHAHHFLFWEATKYLKSRDLQAFDLGGFHEKEMPGITTFKTGLGGKSIELLGGYG